MSSCPRRIEFLAGDALPNAPEHDAIYFVLGHVRPPDVAIFVNQNEQMPLRAHERIHENPVARLVRKNKTVTRALFSPLKNLRMCHAVDPRRPSTLAPRRAAIQLNIDRRQIRGDLNDLFPVEARVEADLHGPIAIVLQIARGCIR